MAAMHRQTHAYRYFRTRGTRLFPDTWHACSMWRDRRMLLIRTVAERVIAENIRTIVMFTFSGILSELSQARFDQWLLQVTSSVHGAR